MRVKDIIAIFLNALFIWCVMATIVRVGDVMFAYWLAMSIAAFIACFQLAET